MFLVTNLSGNEGMADPPPFLVRELCQSVIFGSLTLRKARALDFGVKLSFSKIRMEPVMHDFFAITESQKREVRTIE